MFSAVVLAGERPGGSKFSRELGLPASVLVDVLGQPALQRVLAVLEAATMVQGGLLCGPGEDVLRAAPIVARMLSGTRFRWIAPAAGPSASALAAVRQVGRYPVLLTAGDHALLTPEIVDGFCRRALAREADVVAGLVPQALVRAAFPRSRRTVLRFADGGWCGANLYALLHPAGLRALEFWQEVEAARKQPWKIARRLGADFLLAYLLRRVSLREALQRLGEACDCRVASVDVEAARAAVDVDTLADREIAEQVLRSEG